MISNDGWFAEAQRCPSPNFNDRPATDVDLLVLHNISLPPGQFGKGYVQAFFQNQLDPAVHPYFATLHSLQVSAHLLIDRHGGLIQFVSLDKRAWHAGASSWLGRPNCNDYSIGIELEGTDDQAFSEAQYHTLNAVVLQLYDRFPALNRQRVVGHSDVAPGRKTDPGPFFDWARVPTGAPG